MKLRPILSTICLIVVLIVAVPVKADPDQLRISRVNPGSNLVHVLNTGPEFTSSSALFFCHRFQYPSIPSGTSFPAGAETAFTVSSLHDSLSDLWLYKSSTFNDPTSMVHGVKYGGPTPVGRESVAVAAGLWSDVSAFAPAPPVDAELVWERAGILPTDWYVREPFNLDPPAAKLVWPGGVQDFEDLELGRPAAEIEGWVSIDEGPLFSIRAVADHSASNSPPTGSSRWLRVRDQDDSGQNRFYSGPINAGTDPVHEYAWQWHMVLESSPPAAGAQPPRFTIQHDQQGLFQNAWGIEIADDGIHLVVLGIGGVEDRVLLGPATQDEWMEVSLQVDFVKEEVTGQINSGTAQALPINLAGDADPGLFRFCYRGEGAGNIMQFLLDGLSFSAGALPDDPVFFDRFEQ